MLISKSNPYFAVVLLPLAFTGLLSFPSILFAQTSFTGFIRNYNAVQVTPDHDILIGRNRARLNIQHGLSNGEINISNDIQNLYSADTDSLSYRLREAYVELYFPNSDLRIGRQMLIWGRADGAFITDILTPADLSEFLTQDFSDLRKGVTAFSYSRYFGSDFLQLVVNPVFQPNTIPEPDSRWFPRPVLPTSIPTIYRSFSNEPTFKNIQLAGRYAYRSNLDLDLDVALLYWHYPNPAYFKDLDTELLPPAVNLQLTETFTQSFIAMYSGTLKLSDELLLKSESAFYNQRSFDYLSEEVQAVDLQSPSLAEQVQIAQIFSQNEDGFLTVKPWLISMIGLQYEWLDFTVSTQFVNEHIFNYESTILQERDYFYSTLLLQRSFFRNTWSFRTFGRYNYKGNDFWINPELTYTGIDSFEASIGSQFFGGEQPDPFYGHLSFDNFEDSSFLYLRLSAYF